MHMRAALVIWVVGAALMVGCPNVHPQPTARLPSSSTTACPSCTEQPHSAVRPGPRARSFATNPLEEVDYVEQLVMRWWANREIHEQVDGVDVSRVFALLRHRVQRSSLVDYAVRLEGALATLGDGNLVLQESVRLHRRSRTLLQITLAEEGIVVRNPYWGYSEGVRTALEGAVVVAIGELTQKPKSVQTLLEERVFAGSTPRQRLWSAVALLRRREVGPQPIFPEQITVRSRSGEEFEISLVRAASPPLPPYGPPGLDPTFFRACVKVTTARAEQTSVPVIEVGRFGRCPFDEFHQQLGAALHRIRRAKDIVLDLRGSGGNDDEQGKLLASTLVDSSLPWSGRADFIPGEGWSRDIRSAEVTPSGGPHFAGRLWVLIDARCSSTCDVLVHALRLRRETVLLGEATAGSAGAPALYRLPWSGFVLQIPSSRIYIPGDSTRLVETNPAQPDIAVRPRITDVLAERDPVLSRALVEIRGVSRAKH